MEQNQLATISQNHTFYLLINSQFIYTNVLLIFDTLFQI